MKHATGYLTYIFVTACLWCLMDTVAHKCTTVVGLTLYMERNQCIIKCFDKWAFFVKILSQEKCPLLYRHMLIVCSPVHFPSSSFHIYVYKCPEVLLHNQLSPHVLGKEMERSILPYLFDALKWKEGSIVLHGCKP